MQADIEEDPLPYMMLISGSAYPRTFQKEDEIIVMMSEHEVQPPETLRMKKHFVSEYADGVYRFTHKDLGKHSHFAQAYYNEDEGTMLFQAFTESGFKLMIRDFNATGYNIPDIPYLRVRLQMLKTAETILNRKIVLHEYEDMFRSDPDPHEAEENEKMNKFLSLVIPLINEGREPDIEEIAGLADVDPGLAREMVKMIRQQMRDVKRPDGHKKRKEQTIKEKTKGITGEPGYEKINKIYRAAKLICDLKPWEELSETDIFGVKMPGSGVIWFVSVMGGMGEFPAIAAYKGHEGLAGFNNIQENAPNLPETAIMTVPHLLLSFSDRDELDRENLEAVRKSGVTFRGRGKWPRFEEIIPGFLPAYPEKEVMDDLPLLLDQVISVLLAARGNPGVLRNAGYKGEKILFRIPSGNPAEPEWKDHYEAPGAGNVKVTYKPVFNISTFESVSNLQPSDMVLQAELVLVPSPVKEKGKKPFFPFMLLLVDKNSGMIAGMNLLHPDPDLASVYEAVPEKILGEILKLGNRPDRVEFRSEMLFDLTKNALRQSGCTPAMEEDMPLVEEAIRSLFDNLMG